MGVDSKLLLPITIQPELIIYSLAKACGLEIERDSRGKENPFVANRYWHQFSNDPISPFSFFPLRGDKMNWFNLHLSYDNGEYERGAYRCAEAPCWLLMSRARPEVIAILRTVAEQWGGRLIYRDSDDLFTDINGRLHEMLIDPESGLNSDEPDMRWTALESISFETPVAQVTVLDMEEAAYK